MKLSPPPCCHQSEASSRSRHDLPGYIFLLVLSQGWKISPAIFLPRSAHYTTTTCKPTILLRNRERHCKGKDWTWRLTAQDKHSKHSIQRPVPCCWLGNFTAQSGHVPDLLGESNCNCQQRLATNLETNVAADTRTCSLLSTTKKRRLKVQTRMKRRIFRTNFQRHVWPAPNYFWPSLAQFGRHATGSVDTWDKFNRFRKHSIGCVRLSLDL